MTFKLQEIYAVQISFLFGGSILMTEAYSTLENTMRYYGRVSNGQIVEKGAQIPFNFQLMDLSITSSTREFAEKISQFLENMPRGEKIQANWVVIQSFKLRINVFFSLLNFVEFLLIFEQFSS